MSHAPCPAGRGRLVTLADRPKLDAVRDATVRQLSKLERSSRLPQARQPDEHRVYRVTGQVVLVGRTAAGRRVTIGDGTSLRLVGVIPDDRCTTGADPVYRSRIVKAGSRAKLCSDAVVVGVLFHSPSARGGLRNGVELAPLLSFACVAPKIPFGH